MHLFTFNIADLLTEFKKTFYTMPLMILLNGLFLVLALRYKSKERNYRLFILYGMLSLLADVMDLGLDATAMKPELFRKINALLIISFIEVEFVIFYIFFYLQFDNKKIQKIIKLTGKIFTIFSLLFFIYIIAFSPISTFGTFKSYFSATVSILILIPAFYYFYTLFFKPIAKNLLREPSFWITTGITFLESLNIPIFLIECYFFPKSNNTLWYNLYSINYIAYCFLFILFIISLLCNKELIKKQAADSLTVGLKQGNLGVKIPS